MIGMTGSPIDRYEISAAEVQKGNHRISGAEKGEIANDESANVILAVQIVSTPELQEQREKGQLVDVRLL